MKPTRLLNEDGTASLSTFIMLSHHAFRRDLARFAAALGDRPAELLRVEWGGYYGALHGHHSKEDTDIFPQLRKEHPELGSTIDELSAQHAKIDPLLERATEAFAALPDVGPAAAVIAEITALLDEHLDLEEATVIPLLRGSAEFPPPATDEEAALYAEGFSWSMQGVAPHVIAKVMAMLPQALRVRLPDARSAFDARCRRVWGTWVETAAKTSNPGT